MTVLPPSLYNARPGRMLRPVVVLCAMAVISFGFFGGGVSVAKATCGDYVVMLHGAAMHGAPRDGHGAAGMMGSHERGHHGLAATSPLSAPSRQGECHGPQCQRHSSPPPVPRSPLERGSDESATALAFLLVPGDVRPIGYLTDTDEAPRRGHALSIDRPPRA